MKPNEDVFALVKCVNSVVMTKAKCCDILKEKNIYQKLVIQSLSLVTAQKPYLFTNMFGDPSHKPYVMKEVVKYFLSAKLGHMT